LLADLLLLNLACGLTAWPDRALLPAITTQLFPMAILISWIKNSRSSRNSAAGIKSPVHSNSTSWRWQSTRE